MGVLQGGGGDEGCGLPRALCALAMTGALHGVREKNPPVTALPCQPPLGKGADGTGERIATASDRSRRNSRVIPRPVRRLVVGIRNTPAQRTRRTDCHTSDIGHWFAMTHYKKCIGRADVGIGPYGSATRGAMGGRPQGSPLRRGYKECGGVRNPPVLRPFKIIFFRCSYPCNECVFPVIDRIICLERRTIP